MQQQGMFGRSSLSFLMALSFHAAVVFALWHNWQWSQAVEPLKDVTPLVTLITTAPALPKAISLPELSAAPPVKHDKVIQKQPAPAAPRQANSDRKAHKAVATKAQPSVPASIAEQMTRPLPTAQQPPEAMTPAITSSQTQVEAVPSAQSPSLSASAIKDIASAYRSMVHGRIAALQQYPVLARRMGEEGTVLVRFTILASGKISNVSIMESSGSESLDVAAVAIFMEGLNGQLPPIPPELNKSEWTLSLPIRYQLQ